MVAGESLSRRDTRQWRATLNLGERTSIVCMWAIRSISKFRRCRDGHNRVWGRGWQALSSRSIEWSDRWNRCRIVRVVVRIDSGTIVPVLMGLRRGYAVHGEIITRSERALTLLVEHFRDRSRQLTR